MRLLQLLNVETGVPASTLMQIIATGPKRYKEYDIPKRTGGTRRIAHPASELKAIQRVILAKLLNKCSLSPVASAYVKNRGIRYNAEQHIGQRYLLKLDFKDFFHSIRPMDWDRTVRRTDALQPLAMDQDYFHRILFWGRRSNNPSCLSIGAPTSPMVSNLVCHKLDDWLELNAASRGLRATRYADDITISGPNASDLLKLERDLEKLLEQNKGIQLKFNYKKRGLYGPGERRMVTGLVLTPEGTISIGRERKREILSLVHSFTLGLLETKMIMRTKGLIAFAYSAEETFVTTLRKKYGNEVINTILSFEQEPDPRYHDSDIILYI